MNNGNSSNMKHKNKSAIVYLRPNALTSEFLGDALVITVDRKDLDEKEKAYREKDRKAIVPVCKVLGGHRRINEKFETVRVALGWRLVHHQMC